jgi:ADP-ribose pyrophosphatase YjhB (NUDIX family)
MPKPVTPLVGCDVFVLNEKKQLLLVRRADNGFWALPGGCQELNETPKQAAERECLEESGYQVKVTALLGVYSSTCYEYVNYPWKENRFCHVFYRARLLGGEARRSNETTEVGWFGEGEIPPLTDGHGVRIAFGFECDRNPDWKPHFE